MSDDVTLSIGSSAVSGWTSVSITRGIESMPNKFDLALTERNPDDASDLMVQPGDEAIVQIGSDTVMTGYVDRFMPRIARDEHTIRAIGRARSMDLVDCSAEWPGGQITGATALGIAQKLAQPYGITVAADAGVDVGPAIPQFNLTLGETAYTIIERICRYRGLLFYDNVDGTCLMAQAGNGSHSSGVSEGQHIEVAEGNFTMDQRYSNYVAFLQSVDTLTDTGSGGNQFFNAADPGVTRHRQLDIIAEAGGGGRDVAQKRAIWEAARRAGRSYQLNVTVDSWRDSDGTLWTPNFIVPVSLPSLKAPAYKWVIGEVTYRRDDDGTHADLVIMPRPAFLPEPILLQPFPADVPAGP